MLILRKNGLHEFVLSILTRSLFNTLMGLSHSAFVSKLFISSDSLALRSSMLGSFEGVFRCSQLNHPWQSLKCSVHSTLPIFQSCYLLGVQLIKWAHVFLFLQCISPQNHNLICKQGSNCLVKVYFCCCIVYLLVLYLMQRWPYILSIFNMINDDYIFWFPTHLRNVNHQKHNEKNITKHSIV